MFGDWNPLFFSFYYKKALTFLMMSIFYLFFGILCFIYLVGFLNYPIIHGLYDYYVEGSQIKKVKLNFLKYVCISSVFR